MGSRAKRVAQVEMPAPPWVIPYDEITQGGLIPTAYTKGTDFKPARRLPLERVLHEDGWA